MSDAQQTLVYLRAAAVDPTAASLLSHSFRVVADAQETPAGSFGIVAHGAAVADAVALALAHPERVEAMALMAPPPLDSPAGAALAGRLGELKMPVMVLLGTRDADSPPASGPAYRRAIGDCHLMFVYDVGRDMDAERPEAVAAALREFLRERDRFVVSRKSGRLYP